MTLRTRKKKRHLLDFLAVKKPAGRRRLRIILVFVGIFLFLLVAAGFFSYARIRRVEASAREGEQHFREAQSKALDLDFSAAKIETDVAIDTFQKAHRDIAVFRLLRFVPVLGKQISAADNLLIVARESGSAIRDILEVADSALSTLTENTELTPNALTDEERADILGAIAEGKDSLTSAEAHLDTAREAYHNIPTSGLVRPLAEITSELSVQFPLIDSVIAKALPFTKALPYIAGYPDGNRYLFLLQNNQELRPTGGFIGTYGILDVENGAIREFVTDNVYTLDEAAQDSVTRTPPEPVAHYLGAQQWFFRDANWSPDFPTSAETALQMYEEESGDDRTIDGVIAVTPVLLKDLLAITGPLTVDDISFTEENVIEELRFQVDRGSAERGESGNERKGIIGRLGQELVGALENLPQQKWPLFWNALLENIDERHMLMYFRDAEVQGVFHDQHWDGALIRTEGDSLLFIDANLASLKTDSVIQRALTYRVDLPSGTAEATIQYIHEGSFTSTVTRYRTYLRMYVPFGSILNSSEGFLTDDKLHAGKPTDAVTTTELDHTVFEGFVSIEPKTTHMVTVRYALPSALLETLRRDGYTLLVQKQAGVEQATLTVEVKLGKTISRIEPEKNTERLERDRVRFSAPFTEDNAFTVE